ncbi:helix-turn-helix domain-containing protein [Nibribacter ruber]|uniref:Helix-turn-helix domain-containing protein n=1 Tax=Nibribacter ruber TaxID=2698458 RepID=A0A6P1P4L4_9BACT|nr:helix-turn-helix domain-containing protein [Nibribacter ruber]
MVLTTDELSLLFQQLFRQEIASYFSETALNAGEHKSTKLLTITQAAEFLTLAPATIYSLVSRNEIPYIKKTKRLYFSEQELTEWLNRDRKSGANTVDTTTTLRKEGLTAMHKHISPPQKSLFSEQDKDTQLREFLQAVPSLAFTETDLKNIAGRFNVAIIQLKQIISELEAKEGQRK